MARKHRSRSRSRSKSPHRSHSRGKSPKVHRPRSHSRSRSSARSPVVFAIAKRRGSCVSPASGKRGHYVTVMRRHPHEINFLRCHVKRRTKRSMMA